MIKHEPQRPCQPSETAARTGGDNRVGVGRVTLSLCSCRSLDDTPRAGPPEQAEDWHSLPCHKGNAISRNKGGSGVGGKSLAVGIGEDCASTLHCAGVDDPPTIQLPDLWKGGNDPSLRGRLGAPSKPLAQLTQSSTVSKGQSWALNSCLSGSKDSALSLHEEPVLLNE